MAKPKLEEMEDWELNQQKDLAQEKLAAATDRAIATRPGTKAYESARRSIKYYERRISNISKIMEAKTQTMRRDPVLGVQEPSLVAALLHAGATKWVAIHTAIITRHIHHLLTDGKGYADIRYIEDYPHPHVQTSDWLELMPHLKNRKSVIRIMAGAVNLQAIRTKRSGRGLWCRVDYTQLSIYCANALVEPPEWLEGHDLGERKIQPEC